MKTVQKQNKRNEGKRAVKTHQERRMALSQNSEFPPLMNEGQEDGELMVEAIYRLSSIKQNYTINLPITLTGEEWMQLAAVAQEEKFSAEKSWDMGWALRMVANSRFTLREHALGVISEVRGLNDQKEYVRIDVELPSDVSKALEIASSLTGQTPEELTLECLRLHIERLKKSEATR